MKKIDFHTHILPEIDDGAKDLDVSVNLLKNAYSQGITDVVATPHFSGGEEKVDFFIQKRNESFSKTIKSLDESKISFPNMVCGAEVGIRPGLSEYTNLNALCIENTNYMLVEMPYTMWYDWIFDELYSLIYKRGITPIIAHVERYADKKIDWNKYDKLFSLDVVLQFNSSSFCSFGISRLIYEITKNIQDLPIVLGSDCHDLNHRNITMEKAYKKINRRYGEKFLREIFHNSDLIINNKPVF